MTGSRPRQAAAIDSSSRCPPCGQLIAANARGTSDTTSAPFSRAIRRYAWLMAVSPSDRSTGLRTTRLTGGLACRRPPPEAARSGLDGCPHGATLDRVAATVLPGSRARLRSRLTNRLDAELIGGVLSHHSSDQRIWHLGVAQLGDSVPGACRIVMRVPRSPDDFRGKVLRQFLNQPF